jgi:hypothetical protein
VAAEDATVAVDDVARLTGLRPQALDEASVGAIRDKADILAVRLVRDREAESPRLPTRLVLGEAAERKAQEVELGSCRGKQEITLVARRIPRPVQFRPSGPAIRRA